MSGNIIFVLMYHRHKPLDLNYKGTSGIFNIRQHNSFL
jgi:hypothetical protein